MTELVRAGHGRFRTLPWRGDPQVVQMTPVPGDPPPGPASVQACLDVLARRGVTEVVTGALSPPEAEVFAAVGFTVRDRLHLLAHAMDPIPAAATPPRVRLRRWRGGDRAQLLAVDAAAFGDGFWRMDGPALDDAVRATGAARVRVAVPSGAGRIVLGYLVTGRAGSRGYLQRLAVDPAHQRSGIGAALVADALRWLRRHGVTEALVNTQFENASALALYRRLGFELRPDGLFVLGRAIGGGLS